ncbi:hypothetical protein GCM10022252_76240 [Streptosporangium oxazolinicum]|uniref:RNHCP domain-containing protein n=1 Tax=Streptosporangium oxazolinicum TaxID=909287 RepID=A0ABP8BLD3_9ACTN
MTPGQATLWDLPQPPTRPLPRPDERLPHAKPAPRRNHVLNIPRARLTEEAKAQDCEPTCMVCGKPEGRGLCSPRCRVLCANSAQPGRTEVCIITTRVTARLAVGVHGAEPGRKLAVVDECPHCERVHWHTPQYGTHYRVPPCRQPYLLTLPRPRIGPGGVLLTPGTDTR